MTYRRSLAAITVLLGLGLSGCRPAGSLPGWAQFPAALASTHGIDKVLQIAAKHGCHPLRGVATYRDVYKLTYLRGPSGILVMLAEELKKD